jgi:hypothetical protein
MWVIYYTKTHYIWENIILKSVRRGLINLWLYKETNKLWDWKNVVTLHISPLSSTHLWLLCSNFFNPSGKDSFGCVANRKIENRKSTLMYMNSLGDFTVITTVASRGWNPIYSLHENYWGCTTTHPGNCSSWCASNRDEAAWWWPPQCELCIGSRVSLSQGH